MANSATHERTNPTTSEDAVAELRRLRAEIAAANPDVTDEDWDNLAERWASDIDAALALRVRQSRGETD